MLGRRVTYLALLGLSFLYWCMHKQWLSWMILLMLLIIPVLSLLVSLPAMLTVKARIQYPHQVRQGVPAKSSLVLKCRLPVPPVRCKLRVHNKLTGDRFTGYPGDHIPSKHCGQIDMTYKRLWVYDYLGLFRLPKKQTEPCLVYVLPRLLAGSEPHPMEQHVTAWKPKPGGGFSENHDLRLYRPGDDLRQIHWKMAAKTGKLIYREPVEPVCKDILLILTLSGTAEELDRKLGRLLWVSGRLLEQELLHEIRCQTADGIVCLEVRDLDSQERAIQRLLESPATTGEWDPEHLQALWQCRIGGGPDEK